MVRSMLFLNNNYKYIDIDIDFYFLCVAAVGWQESQRADIFGCPGIDTLKIWGLYLKIWKLY